MLDPCPRQTTLDQLATQSFTNRWCECRSVMLPPPKLKEFRCAPRDMNPSTVFRPSPVLPWFSIEIPLREAPFANLEIIRPYQQPYAPSHQLSQRQPFPLCQQRLCTFGETHSLLPRS